MAFGLVDAGQQAAQWLSINLGLPPHLLPAFLGPMTLLTGRLEIVYTDSNREEHKQIRFNQTLKEEKYRSLKDGIFTNFYGV